MGQDDRTGFLIGNVTMALDRFNPLKWIGLAPTKYQFYRTWVTVRSVGSTKSCRPRDNFGYIRYPVNGSRGNRGKKEIIAHLDNGYGKGWYLGYIIDYMFWEHGRFGWGPRHSTGVNHIRARP
ncbi:hypothetical protein PIB30_052826 [Stylosanthes scabra]|uniref:Uncharacterized protein n=1 Tax=Stylosanthes scabra TaxID=79078 RepID=A0ABU6ZH46_9FABA|nr:hypothetical protein [Stylosanthes scabra]